MKPGRQACQGKTVPRASPEKRATLASLASGERRVTKDNQEPASEDLKEDPVFQVHQDKQVGTPRCKMRELLGANIIWSWLMGLPGYYTHFDAQEDIIVLKKNSFYFQDQAMNALTSFRGTKSCNIEKKCALLAMSTNLCKGHDRQWRKNMQNIYLCIRQKASCTYPPQVFTSVHLFNKIVRSRFTISSPLFQNNWVKIHHRKNKVR